MCMSKCWDCSKRAVICLVNQYEESGEPIPHCESCAWYYMNEVGLDEFDQTDVHHVWTYQEPVDTRDF